MQCNCRTDGVGGEVNVHFLLSWLLDYAFQYFVHKLFISNINFSTFHFEDRLVSFYVSMDEVNFRPQFAYIRQCATTRQTGMRVRPYYRASIILYRIHTSRCRKHQMQKLCISSLFHRMEIALAGKWEFAADGWTLLKCRELGVCECVPSMTKPHRIELARQLSEHCDAFDDQRVQMRIPLLKLSFSARV